MGNRSLRLRTFMGLALACVRIEAPAGQFVLPAGYAGNSSAPGVARECEPGAPRIVRLPDESLSDRFLVDAAYPRPTHAKVVGAFAIAEPAGTRLVDV